MGNLKHTELTIVNCSPKFVGPVCKPFRNLDINTFEIEPEIRLKGYSYRFDFG